MMISMVVLLLLITADAAADDDEEEQEEDEHVAVAVRPVVLLPWFLRLRGQSTSTEDDQLLFPAYFLAQSKEASGPS